MEKIANQARRNLLRGRFKTAAKPTPLRLPWSISNEVFTSLCTKCDKCIDSCETSVLKKDQQGYPYIDFSQGECTFCQACIDECEQPLFISEQLRQSEMPWQADITINQSCLANNHIYCQSCRDACEPQAIKFSFTQGAIPTPEINQQDCTFCGACVSTCPQNSITIKELNNESAG